MSNKFQYLYLKKIIKVIRSCKNEAQLDNARKWFDRVTYINKMPISLTNGIIKAYRAIGSFRGECSFYTWIYRITVNTAKSFLESNSKHRYAVDVDAPEFESQDTQGVLTSNESPDRLIESDELKRVIFKALNELPSDLKQAIMLREIEGKSYDEIAEIMKTPIGTVRSRIFRARQFIEEQMAKISGN